MTDVRALEAEVERLRELLETREKQLETLLGSYLRETSLEVAGAIKGAVEAIGQGNTDEYFRLHMWLNMTYWDHYGDKKKKQALADVQAALEDVFSQVRLMSGVTAVLPVPRGNGLVVHAVLIGNRNFEVIFNPTDFKILMFP